MEDKSFQLEGKAEHTEDDNPNVKRFHIQPNRISQLWWKAQGLTKLADVHNELSYEEFTAETNKLWETLAKEEGILFPLLKQKILECSKNLPTMLFTYIFSESPFI